MFYTARQNNSGGYFIMNEDVSQYVIIEADNVEQAQNKLYKITEEYSEYCPCCGERWEDVEYVDGYEKPSIHGKEISKVKKSMFRDECIVYYLDGRKEIFKFED